MSEADKVFAKSVPEFYDTWMVPLIFEGYAADLARRVAAAAPQSVLETAAGSGALTRALAPLLGSGAAYVATDLNQPMLDRAASRQGPDPRITWLQADALALPFADGGFDAVACQFGVMFFPDRVAGFREACRVLRPGGGFFFNTWDAIEGNTFAMLVTEAAGAAFPADPPRFLARTPHGYHDVGRIRADLLAAGFGQVKIETIAMTSVAASARDAAMAYCQGTPLRAEIEARGPGRLEEITNRAAAAIAAACGDGAVSGRIQGHVVTARA